MNVKLTWALAGKVLGILGVGVTLVWGAANQVRNVDDNTGAIMSLSRKSRRMSMGIRRNRDDIRYMVIMQELALEANGVKVPARPNPEPDNLNDHEVNDAGR